PYSNQQYTLTPQKINDLLTGDGLTEKAQMYKQLVEKAKTRYPEYRDGLATGKGVELFAPVVDGKNICEEINLYTYWQGFGYAKKTPRIKYLLVAQDWGSFFNADAEPFKDAILKLNAGEDVPYPFSMKSPTDKNLIELFKILKRDITKPCDDVFFTNFCLGYRFGKDSGDMTNKLMMNDADIFRELCEILEPENILCLGQITSECVYEALTGEKSARKMYCGTKNYGDLLDLHFRFTLYYGENKKFASKFYPLAHCGGMGTANRPLHVQIKDWERIE
ncbi:MAG: hypothetical protein IJP68_06100, partial [Selenomonadaceae bacterium]|nr:hypothetical protein [Selenomonadaceae bacterium]